MAVISQLPRLLLVSGLLACVWLSDSAAAEADFYQILELENGDESTDKDIKAAFRRLSRELHPDQNPDPSAKEKYKLIQRAHDVLGDKRKRKMYDIRGEEGVKQLEESAQNQHHGGGMLQNFFGGQAVNPHKGQDVEMNLEIPLNDAYNGVHHHVEITKQKLCKKCKGTGAADKESFKTCKHCRATGHVVQQVQIMPGFVQNQHVQCPKCKGKGKSVTKPCSVCKGKRVHKRPTQVPITIERGVPEDHAIRDEMGADQHPDKIPGDIVFRVKTTKHPVFTRKGHDLEATLTIGLKEALLGFTRPLTHLDGRTIHVEKHGTTQHNEVVVVQNEGMPKFQIPSEKGNLYVTIKIQLPNRLTAAQKEVFQDVFDYKIPTDDADEEEGADSVVDPNYDPDDDMSSEEF